MGPVTFQLTEADYLYFTRLIWRSNLGKKSGIILAMLTLLGVSALNLWAGGPHAIPNAVEALAVIGIGASATLAVMYFLYLPHYAAKTWQEYKLLGETMTMTANFEVFTISQPAAHITSPWTNMLKWNEDNRIFAIHVASQMAYIIPKNTATLEMVDYSRQCLIASGLPRKGKPRK